MKTLDIINLKNAPFVVDFQISRYCNYACRYCIVPKKQNNNQADIKLAGILAGLLKTKRQPKTIVFSGCEPTTHPQFVEICGIMAQVPDTRLIIYSNMSCSMTLWDKLLANVKINKIVLKASFHPDFADMEKFVKDYHTLKDRGLEIRSNIVAAPDRFEQVSSCVKQLSEAGIQATPIRCRTNDSVMTNYAGDYVKWLRDLNISDDGPRNNEGKICAAGYSTFWLSPEGEMWMCHTAFTKKDHTGYLGNLYNNGFDKLFPRQRLCRYEYCPCDSVH